MIILFENIFSDGLACRLSVFLTKEAGRLGSSRLTKESNSRVPGTIIFGFTKTGAMKQAQSTVVGFTS